MKIGFIGLGIMGKPMARNLLKAGYELTVYNTSRPAVDELVADGAIGAASCKEVAQASEIVVLMVPNSPNVKDAVLGQNGIIEGAKAGTIVVDMSSIAPQASQEVAAEAAKHGVIYLDSPVSGGEPKAIEGTLAVMVGGDKAAFDKVEPILKHMASSVTYTGAVGSGNTTKLANQIIVALNIAAVSEALILATKAGVDPEVVYKAIRGGLAGSTVLDAKAPKILNGDFAPGFRVELHVKDLLNAMEAARDMEVSLTFSVKGRPCSYCPLL